ncbi:MAG: MAPEG family protein [Gammaproteobacteria bacterium]
MTPELTILAWTLVLAVAQILLPATLRNKETGIAYNVSARDTPAPPPRPLTGRLQRAHANLMETLPLFAAAVLMAHVTGREGGIVLLGAQIYAGGRLLYLPVYALGIPYLRSAVWGISLSGLMLILVALLK